MKKEFNVFHKEYRGDDPWTVVTFDAESAAEEYAEYYDSDGEYSLFSGRGTIDVLVVDKGGAETWFTVEREARPHYMVHERKAK